MQGVSKNAPMFQPTTITHSFVLKSKICVAILLASFNRWRFAVLFLSSVYPHYYAYWAVWNYINDDFYDQMWHQALFTSTEILSTVIILRLADSDTPVTPTNLLIIISIAAGE